MSEFLSPASLVSPLDHVSKAIGLLQDSDSKTFVDDVDSDLLLFSPKSRPIQGVLTYLDLMKLLASSVQEKPSMCMIGLPEIPPRRQLRGKNSNVRSISRERAFLKLQKHGQ